MLALEDGRVFHGTSFAAAGTVCGEVCFNTAMTGYQEILTDPSYRGQIVVMTYPEIGNTGVNGLDQESHAPHVRGFVVASLSPVVSNWRASEPLESYLRRFGVPGLKEVDTRALARHLRERGALRGCISSELSAEAAVERARLEPLMEGADFVREVAPDEASDWDPEGRASRRWRQPSFQAEGSSVASRSGGGAEVFEELPPVFARVVLMDFGAKHNIPRLLRQRGLEVRVLPATATPEQVMECQPDGVFLSNGPGDPATLDYAHRTVRELAGRLPIFGICLGHQIICLALGARTFKLKFGHRGANHPVGDKRGGRVAITSQNHGFAVDPETLPAELEVTAWNLNDHTVAGVRHRQFPIAAVQFHPEASPGPHDAETFFDEFVKAVRAHREAQGFSGC